jgi:hypothetical protein
MTLTLPMTLDGEEVEVVVVYDLFPATQGQRDSLGVPMEPDDGACVEVQSYKVGGADIESQLTPQQLGEIERKCLEREGAE